MSQPEVRMRTTLDRDCVRYEVIRDDQPNQPLWAKAVPYSRAYDRRAAAAREQEQVARKYNELLHK